MKVICTNRKAYHDYHIEETLEAGIALSGTEVKSLREGRANLKDSFAKIKNGEVFLVNAHISPYSYGNIFNHEPKRDRKLLLHKREINKLTGKVNERGYTLVPLSMYFNKQNRAKVELALVKGKTLYDKRESIKRKDEKRLAEREIRIK
ncbi:MAG TPA: SsrA-binding protein SmpB [Syntrophorhabdaceae bacterium]|nr:SsrA-binding protein SmpB [Syntrophorhabdaceae bacterium]HOL06272.1 SsrA-binding protein SmpB [Syntrophorhabdaceae bacterium]HON86276.1 SsrA-binding protein SmpB [Syntrophorhabdaceae bacterium]HOT42801.1 SsrA-binding protein SmpB [Syntrophorhabdaceae bacterium]HPP42782.1 SsrA-binding protein SmpB [Syntrophorhabdaceae bacterium]